MMLVMTMHSFVLLNGMYDRVSNILGLAVFCSLVSLVILAWNDKSLITNF